MATLRLNDRRVDALRPRKSAYDVRDRDLKGFGVRVRPSGHRSFVYCRKGEGGPRRITLGPAALTGVDEAHTKCLAIETGERSDPARRRPVITFGDFVSGPGRACIDRCKPSTQKAGPRRVFLSARARAILGRQPRTGSAWVFPSPLNPERPRSPNLPVVSRLLGHKHPSITRRYAHVGDRETEAAAERIGAAIARAMDVDAADSDG